MSGERTDGWCGACGRRLPTTDRAPWAHSTCAETCRSPEGCMNPDCPHRPARTPGEQGERDPSFGHEVLRDRARQAERRAQKAEAERAEHQWNALEMARKADIAEARAEGAEAAIEGARDVLDGWEQDGPDDPALHLLIRRVREALGGVAK